MSPRSNTHRSPWLLTIFFFGQRLGGADAAESSTNQGSASYNPGPHAPCAHHLALSGQFSGTQRMGCKRMRTSFSARPTIIPPQCKFATPVSAEAPRGPAGAGFLTSPYYEPLTGHTRVPGQRSPPDPPEIVGYFRVNGSLHAQGIRRASRTLNLYVAERLAILGKGNLFGPRAVVTPARGLTANRLAVGSCLVLAGGQAAGFRKDCRPRDTAARAGCQNPVTVPASQRSVVSTVPSLPRSPSRLTARPLRVSPSVSRRRRTSPFPPRSRHHAADQGALATTTRKTCQWDSR